MTRRLTARLVFGLLIVSSAPLMGQTNDRRPNPAALSPVQKTGIDPTDIRTRIEAAFTYTERANGVDRQNINLRLEREFAGQSFNLRLDIPFIAADIPDMSSEDGIGDIGVRLNYRYMNTPGRSAVLGATLTLDTASDDSLGDGTTKLTGVWVNSWRKKVWMLSMVGLATWSESGDHDRAGVVPIVAYQPMRKYWSYVSLGVPVIRDLSDDETITIGLVRIGKVFRDGRVLYAGSRYDLSGNSDDDFVATLGYRMMVRLGIGTVMLRRVPVSLDSV